jgi:hypothetical protein
VAKVVIKIGLNRKLAASTAAFAFVYPFSCNQALMVFLKSTSLP